MKRLMVVDDEAVITTQLEDRLRSMEYDVVGTASSAEESVSMARELCPDLILMDIVMKGKLDGIDAAKIIKADMDIPIIFLTAYTDDKYIKRAKNVEPFGYMVKPFRENEIRANIEIALYKKELERKRKQAEERIRRLFLAIDHNPYMVMIIDAGGNIEFINNKFCQITNYTPKEVVGKNIRFLKSDEMLPELYKEMWEEIASGKEWRGELSIKKKDGISDLKYTVTLPVKNIKGDIVFFLVVMEEIAKHEKRREMLLQPEKLNAMKTMTAGIAHEFNNIFAAISSNTQLLREDYSEIKGLRDGLRTIQKATADGAELISYMVKLTKMEQNTSKFKSLDISTSVKHAIDFTMPRWKIMAQAKGINYHIDRKDVKKVPPVLGNPLEIKVVFINIINNALDAMPDGGRISFSTWHRSGTLSNEDTVFVSISDTGKGMSKEVKRKIFEPFFTTRSPQKTGLGMSVAYSIITRHGGKIEVESEEGKGTMLTLSMPIKNKIERQKILSKPTRGIMAKGLRILVVDDNEDVCMVLDKFFSRVGHIVKVVGKGAEAIELIKSEDYDLVLCDLIMPEVSGYDVIKALNKLKKRPKIGIITDWYEKPKLIEDEGFKFDFIVKKPFDFSELSRNVNDILING